MDYKVKKEYRSEELYAKAYETTQPLNTKNIINMINNYVNNNAELYKCICNTFSENGHPMHKIYYSVEELQEMYKLPNPSMNIKAYYIDKYTHKYLFDISTAANTNVIYHYVDKKTADRINNEIELSNMLEKKNDYYNSKNFKL